MSNKTLAWAKKSKSTTSSSSTPLPIHSLSLSAKAALNVQAALKVGRANDACEKQADAVADKVVAGQTAVLSAEEVNTPQLNPVPQKQEGIQRKGEMEEEDLQAKGEEEEEELQAKGEMEEEELQAKDEEEEEELQAKVEEEEEDLQAKGKEEEEELQAKVEEEEEDLQAKVEEEEEDLQAKGEEEEEDLWAKGEEEEEELQAKGKQEKKEETVQRQPGRSKIKTASHESLMANAKNRPGFPLPQNVKDKMERAFGQDFSGVRIHHDQAAVVLNQKLGARALTSGNDIYFNQHEFAPESREGTHLLAHELTHTIQQQGVRRSIQRQEDENADYLIRPELLDALKMARGQIGQVNAKQTNENGNRIGWEQLAEFFNVAFGGQHPLSPDVIKKRVMIPDGKGGSKDALPSWCGIFVWWSLKSAGIPIPDWTLGQSVMNHLVARKPGELPKKGDIAYRHKNQHFAIVSGVVVENGKAQIATINGNTAGADNLGGQIQEQWHSPSQWAGFFDTVAKLNLPDVPLVSTGAGPDLDVEEPTSDSPPSSETRQASEVESPVDTSAESAESDSETASEAAAATDATRISAAQEAVELELPDIPPAQELEPVANIESLQFSGTSEDAIQTTAAAKPSQLAMSGHQLGGAVEGKLSSEQQAEVENAPDLTVNLAGNVQEGFVTPDALGAGNPDMQSAGELAKPDGLTVDPHKNHGDAPSNKTQQKELDRQSQSGGFLDWLKANISRFMSTIRTSDPNLNTSAGPKQKVKLEGASDPGRMTEQRQEAGDKMRAQRDEVTAKMQSHPGQGNIKAKAVQESKPVTLKPVESEPVTTETSDDATDYAEAELPQDIRDKADEKLAKNMQKNLDKAGADAKGAAATRDTDKKNAQEDAESKTDELNRQADEDQKKIVIDNRKSVGEQQSLGIKQAYGKVTEFETDAGKQQKTQKKAIDDKVKTSEEKADAELTKGEKDAEAKKKQGEKEAKEEKEKLEKEQKKQSWWERAKNAIKKAVKAITEAIDKVFNAIRAAVKDIIDKAKQLAIDAINTARNVVVDKLNQFRDWAKDKVNKYLGEHFPGVAAAINGAIDGVVDVAVAGVNMVADGAIAAVEAVADALAAALDKILSVFQAVIKAAVQIIGAIITGDFVEALKIAIRTGCEIAGVDSKPVFDFFDRAGKQLVSILKNPGKFFNNLVTAVGMGVRGFVKNIKQHLIKGLIGWLTGTLSEANITLPETFDVKGIFSLVMQILGLTYANIKARVIKRYPPAEKVINAVEKGVEIIHLLITKGPIALWEIVKEKMANLKQMVMGAIRSYVISTVIKEAVTWVLGLLNPAGALVKIIKLLFDLVMFLVQRFQQIKDFVLSVYEGITSIASGVLGKAAAAVENAMAKSLPVVIGLLASLAGLGGIGKTVQGIIKKVTTPINKVIDKVIDKVIGFAKKLLKKGKQAAKKIKDKLVQWWKVSRKFKADNGESHTLFLKGKGTSAKLTMRSAETPYQQFLNGIKESNLNDTQKTSLKNAQKKWEEIETLKKKKIEGNNDAEKKKNANKKKADLEKLLAQLGTLSAPLFDSDDLEPFDLGKILNGTDSAGFGVSMNAKMLAKKQPGWAVGSSPTQAAHNVYDVLNWRRQSGGASFYIRGHLLNDNLGGPGKWNNMVPLSREGNHQHEAQAESVVKNWFNAGAVQRYSVKPTYGAHGDPNAVKDALKAKFPTQADTFNKILDAEKFVPSAIDIKAATLKKKGEHYVDDKTQTWNINNTIDRNANNYFLSDSPKIETVNLYEMSDSSGLTKLGDNVISAHAQAIFNACQARKAKQDSTWFPSYLELGNAVSASQAESIADALQNNKYIKLR